MPDLAIIAAAIVVGFMGALGAVIVWKMLVGGIDIALLISEKTGATNQASISRLQLLIFTYVIAVGILVITLETGQFPKLSPEILTLLGISSGSYVLSKGIQTMNQPEPGKDGDKKQPNPQPGE